LKIIGIGSKAVPAGERGVPKGERKGGMSNLEKEGIRIGWQNE